MKKTLILVLTILVQSQSDGVLLAKPNTKDRFWDLHLEGWRDGEESPYEEDVSKDYDRDAQPYKKRLLTNDAFTRRSALDKNFMRFGRGSDALEEHRPPPLPRDRNLDFYRFARGLKDKFIRFGRTGEKSGFIRFGRTRPEDFFRAGKSLRESFIRFGKADENFLRFAREKSSRDYRELASAEEPLQRPPKSSRAQENFIRFGKSGKNATNFLTSGKGDEAEEETDGSGETRQEETNRERRHARDGSPTGRPAKTFFYASSQNSRAGVSPTLVGSSPTLQNSNNSRLTPYLPVFLNLANNADEHRSEAKRNQGTRNFIRFG